MVAQGLAQLRTGTKSLSGFSFKQVGFWFIHPLSFGSPPPLSRLFRQTPHQALPFPTVHQTLFGESIALLCMLWSISDYLLCRSHWEESPEIQVSSTSCGSLWCEDRLTLGKGLALVELGRRQYFANITYIELGFCETRAWPWPPPSGPQCNILLNTLPQFVHLT